MKKLCTTAFLGLFGLCLTLSSCSGNGSEKQREDSIRMADSIAQVEAMKAQAEQARLDSLRQDSIKKAEETEKMMRLDPSLLVSSKKYKEFIKKFGFTVYKTKYEKWDEYMDDGAPAEKIVTYKRDINGNTVTITNSFGDYEIKFSNPEEKDNFVADAKASGFSENPSKTLANTGAFYSLVVKGNTVCLYGEH